MREGITLLLILVYEVIQHSVTVTSFPTERSSTTLPTDDDPRDFLVSHPLVYAASIFLLFLFQTLVLVCMGQPLVSPRGVNVWYGNVGGPGNSQHMMDWYTFTHIVHGVLMYFLFYLCLPEPPMSVNYNYLLALGTAVGWEIVENTPCVINQYRKTAVAAGYNGDSVLNSFCDSVAMSLGYWASFYLPFYVTVVFTVLEEIILGFVIRDNMILNVIQLVFSFKCISDWQAKKGEGTRVVSQQEQGHDIGDHPNGPETQE